MVRDVIFSLGSNLGDRYNLIEEMIANLITILQPPVKVSRFMETEPIGTPGEQQWFLNCILGAGYGQDIKGLLEICQGIEKKLGRKEKKTLAARTADIDILLVQDFCLVSPELHLPHPQILNRRFCLEGIYEIAADMIHPGLNQSFTYLYKHMPEDIKQQKVRFTHNPNLETKK